MTKFTSLYRGTYRKRPYECQIATAELSLRFDYSWSEDMYLDVIIACQSLTEVSDDASTYIVQPAIQLDGLILPATAPLDRNFRKLDQFEFAFHQPIAPDGGRLYDLDAPGWLYFGQGRQIDDLSMRLHYLGHAEFHITLSGTAEEDTLEIATVARFTDASMLHRGTAANAVDMDIVVHPDAVEIARKAGQRWIDMPHPSERALAAFARRLNIHDYAIATRVDADDMNVGMVGRPIELQSR